MAKTGGTRRVGANKASLNRKGYDEQVYIDKYLSIHDDLKDSNNSVIKETSFKGEKIITLEDDFGQRMYAVEGVKGPAFFSLADAKSAIKGENIKSEPYDLGIHWNKEQKKWDVDTKNLDIKEWIKKQKSNKQR